MNDSFAEGLSGISSDRGKGANQLATDGLILMAEALKALSKIAPDRVPESGRDMLRRLGEARPSMAPVFNWGMEFLREIEKSAEKEGPLNPEAIGRIKALVLDRKEDAAQRHVEKAAKFLKNVKSALTISYSSTIEKIITQAAPRGFKVIAAESRPLFEGARIAEAALMAGLDAELVTDAAMGLAAREVDIVLLGADAILADLAVVNKTGSLLAALAARHASKRIIAAADTYKINPRYTALTAPLEEGPGEEVSSRMAAISRNVYFEPVPARLISGYLTEKGLLGHAAMRKEVERTKRALGAAVKKAYPRRPSRKRRAR